MIIAATTFSLGGWQQLRTLDLTLSYKTSLLLFTTGLFLSLLGGVGCFGSFNNSSRLFYAVSLHIHVRIWTDSFLEKVSSSSSSPLPWNIVFITTCEQINKLILVLALIVFCIAWCYVGLAIGIYIYHYKGVKLSSTMEVQTKPGREKMKPFDFRHAHTVITDSFFAKCCAGCESWWTYKFSNLSFLVAGSRGITWTLPWLR